MDTFRLTRADLVEIRSRYSALRPAPYVRDAAPADVPTGGRRFTAEDFKGMTPMEMVAYMDRVSNEQPTGFPRDSRPDTTPKYRSLEALANACRGKL